MNYFISGKLGFADIVHLTWSAKLITPDRLDHQAGSARSLLDHRRPSYLYLPADYSDVDLWQAVPKFHGQESCF
jgi:hypothetical protein